MRRNSMTFETGWGISIIHMFGLSKWGSTSMSLLSEPRVPVVIIAVGLQGMFFLISSRRSCDPWYTWTVRFSACMMLREGHTHNFFFFLACNSIGLRLTRPLTYCDNTSSVICMTVSALVHFWALSKRSGLPSRYLQRHSHEFEYLVVIDVVFPPWSLNPKPFQ
jgi:hypothetical protein